MKIPFFSMLSLNLPLHLNFEWQKIISHDVFQIFSVKPSFRKYFLCVKLAESTTFPTSETECMLSKDYLDLNVTRDAI